MNILITAPARTFWKNSLVVLALLLSSADMFAAKFIETGWDMPDTCKLRDDLAAMEKCPFNGVVLKAAGARPDQKTCQLREAFTNENWDENWFHSALDDLRACKFHKFTDNFVLVGANPGNVDWNDDAAWHAVAEHWRIAARLAKKGGLKGILFDPEPYTPPYRQFFCSGKPEFVEKMKKCARLRGREIMREIASEFPDITIFCCFANSVLPTENYVLLPAFVDGWLDESPATVTIVDGCERAYTFNTREQFLDASVKIKGSCQRYVSPENRAKYRAQVQTSFSIYLDAYINPPSSRYYVPGGLDALRSNLEAASSIADEYIWVYGEKARWWVNPGDSADRQFWNEVFPGCKSLLHFMSNPLDFAKQQIAHGAKPVKLSDDWKIWKNWTDWKNEGGRGEFLWNKENATGVATQAANGCFYQHVEVNPGEYYAVEALCQKKGEGDAFVLVRWQTKENKWTDESRDVPIYPDASGKCFAVVMAPTSAGYLSLLLSAKGQTTPTDTAIFSDVRLFRLQ